MRRCMGFVLSAFVVFPCEGSFAQVGNGVVFLCRLAGCSRGCLPSREGSLGHGVCFVAEARFGSVLCDPVAQLDDGLSVVEALTC